MPASPSIAGSSFLPSFLPATPSGTSAQEAIQTPATGEKKGWFWYEVIPDPPDEEEVESEEKTSASATPQMPSLKDYTLEQIWFMHPDEFNPLMKAFHKKAVQAPTVENVYEYKVVEDIARRKASTMADVTMLVVQMHPELNAAKDYPSVGPGRAAYVAQQKAEVEAGIAAAKDEFALLYFHSESCPYCVEQSGILKFFAVKYGWQIRPISITENPGMAAQFKVVTVPHLELVYKKSRNSFPVAAGVVSLSEIEQRLYRAIRYLKGDVSPWNWSTYDFQKGGAFDTEAFIGTARAPDGSQKGVE